MKSVAAGGVMVLDVKSQITGLQRIGGALQRFPAVYRAATLSLQGLGRARRRIQLKRYFSEVRPEDRGLLVGSGAMTLDGWLCTDLVPVRPSIVYLDATKPWPMPSDSFSYAICEHMIEHVPYEAALDVLRETRRVLRPGGILRISTPDLDVIRLLPDRTDSEVSDYIEWNNRTFGSPLEQEEASSAVHALNRMMRAWGHTYLFNEATLRHLLSQAGFHRVVRSEPEVSEHPKLMGADRHGALIGEAVNRVDCLILEATV